MMQRSVGLRLTAAGAGAKSRFQDAAVSPPHIRSAEWFAGTESERIRRSVELPGTPAEGAVRP
ncbi:hypothetical protein DW841_12645 [Hungatella hathewayi]|nr:hypothetical protein DW841_12645 [Hungatella hathewayi]